jgi:small nuclear ribonucleoprotein (snRNP)-like protein
MKTFKNHPQFRSSMETRPLDALNQARNKKVVVELKNGKNFVGTLRAFDIHINVVLGDAEEFSEGVAQRKMSVVFIRGDTIVLISPHN